MEKNRREILIERMDQLEAEGMSCRGCSGTCCTYESNSMLITPLETKEILIFLKSKGLDTPDLKNKLLQTVTNYRLEPRLPKQRSYLRKTYTCPFFNHQELGCPLPREIKPYGCLAFNSHHKNLKADSNCFSEKELLERREALHPEETEINHKMKSEYDIYWEKAPIPNALLELWDKI